MQGSEKKTFIALIGLSYQQVISLFSGLLIARVVGAADYGVFNLARNLMLLVSIFTRLGLDLGLMRFFGELGQGSEGQLRRIKKLSSLRIVAAFVSLLPALVIAFGLGDIVELYIYKFDNFSTVMLLTFLALPFLGDLAILGGAYRGMQNASPSIVVENIIMPTIRLVLVFVLFSLGWRLWAVVVGTSISSCVAWVILALWSRRDFKSPSDSNSCANGVEDETLSHLLRYSIVLAAAMGVTSVSRMIDTLLLGCYGSAVELGQYSVIQMMLLLVGLFGSALGQSLGSQVAERWQCGDRFGVEHLLAENSRLIGLVSMPIFFVFFFWGNKLILIFGQSYIVSSFVMQSLACGSLIITILANAGYALSMTGHQKLELKILFIGLVSTVVVCGVFITNFGLLGAAMGSSISLLITNVFRIIVVRKVTGVFHLRMEHARLFFVLFLAGLPVWYLVGLLDMGDFISAIISSVIYVFIVIFIEWKWMFKQSDREFIVALIKKNKIWLFA